MPVQSNITLKDGQATPVDHVFAPKGASMSNGKSTAVWRDNTQASLIAKWTLTEHHQAPTQASPEKFRYVFRIPTTTTDSAGNVVSNRFATLEIAALIPYGAQPPEIADVVALAKNFTASTAFSQAVLNREASW